MKQIKLKEIYTYENLDKILEFTKRQLINNLPQKREGQINFKDILKCACILIKPIKENNITLKQGNKLLFKLTSTRLAEKAISYSETGEILAKIVENKGNIIPADAESNWNELGIFGLPKILGFENEKTLIKEIFDANLIEPEKILQNLTITEIQNLDLLSPNFNYLLTIENSEAENTKNIVMRNYKIKENGIFLQTQKNDWMRINTKPIIITKCILIENEEFYTFCYKIGKKIISKQLSINDFNTVFNICKCGLPGITSVYAKEMVLFFNDFIDKYNIIDNAKIAFDNLKIDEEGKYVGYNSKYKCANEELQQAIIPKGDKEKSMNFNKDIWLNSSKIICFEMLKLGLSLCIHQDADYSFFTELIGDTGIGKTHLMHLRISLYGDPYSSSLIGNANQTSNSFEFFIAQKGYLPAELDEGEILRDKLKKQKGDITSLTYNLSNKVGRGRLQKRNSSIGTYGLNKKNSLCTLINYTIENSILGDDLKDGVLNRYISTNYFEKDRYEIDNEFIKENYGWFMQEAVNYFTKPELLAFLKENKEKILELSKEISNKQQRLFGYLCFCLKQYNKILGKCKYEPENFLEYFRKKSELNNKKEIIESVYNYIFENHSFLFTKIDAIAKQEKEAFRTIKYIGAVEDDYFFISTNKLKEFIKNKYNISINVLGKILDDAKLIVKGKDGKFSQKKYLATGVIRCFQIKRINDEDKYLGLDENI